MIEGNRLLYGTKVYNLALKRDQSATALHCNYVFWNSVFELKNYKVARNCEFIRTNVCKLLAFFYKHLPSDTILSLRLFQGWIWRFKKLYEISFSHVSGGSKSVYKIKRKDYMHAITHIMMMYAQKDFKTPMNLGCSINDRSLRLCPVQLCSVSSRKMLDQILGFLQQWLVR